MTAYSFIRPLLFLLDAERAHQIVLRMLRLIYALPGLGRLAVSSGHCPNVPLRLMNLDLHNPVGLAAGLDKNAECVDIWCAVGFGFIEVGTVTPRPQPGNAKPRLFRVESARAIINRMGFNNAGVDGLLKNLRHARRRCPLGINIGKNKDTPPERAIDDYVEALAAVYAQADYVTINISSPNTPGLRALQDAASLERLLATLKARQYQLRDQYGRYVPIALKIAPDLDDEQIAGIAEQAVTYGVDAIIATNTTTDRDGVREHPAANEAGGLSGAPLKAKSTAVIAKVYAVTRGRVPIIGVGGIFNTADAWEKMVAGADAVQVYSALIYRGPGLVREIVQGLADKVRSEGGSDLRTTIQHARERAAAKL